MSSKRIIQLLQDMVEAWPERRKILERHLRKDDERLQLVVKPALSESTISTFRKGHYRELSPMLRERFAFGGSIFRATQTWLDQSAIVDAIDSEAIRKHHKSRREHWEGSAPMRFDDSDLSLFGISPDSPEDVVYLVWHQDVVEPELWNYHGMSERQFKDLEEYLRWAK